MTTLVRVVPGEDLGYRRRRSGSGFRYVDQDGHPAPEPDRERIHDLVIPPAWEDVWIAADPLAHIQVVGTDEAGRRQYLYHPLWRVRRDRSKFRRALDLAERLPRARARVTRALGDESLSRERVLATAFRLLDDAALRVGSERYLVKHGSRGLTTLRRRDVKITASTSPCPSRRRAVRRRRSRSLTRRSPMSSRSSPPAPIVPSCSLIGRGGAAYASRLPR